MLSLFILSSCKEERKEITQKEKLNLLYIILDKSSNSFSASGGREENYIDIDTTYINNLLETLFKSNKNNKSKSSVVLSGNSHLTF